MKIDNQHDWCTKIKENILSRVENCTPIANVLWLGQAQLAQCIRIPEFGGRWKVWLSLMLSVKSYKPFSSEVKMPF